MNQHALTATEVISRRVRELRDRRGRMSAQALADRCAELGMPSLKRQAITNLENGRRDAVTVEELLVLATALDVPPALLILPLDGRTDLELGPGRTMSSWRALFWLGGESEPVDPEERQRWRQTIGPVSLHRDFRECFQVAARLENRVYQDDGSLVANPDPQFPGRLKELAKIAEWMLDSDITPPAIPANWHQIMTAEGWAKRPEEIPVQAGEG